MTINAVKDPTGKVVATFENPMPSGPTIKPVLPAGHTVEPMEVADNYLQNLSALYSPKGK